jgi:iron complex outermembrane recepter protein
MKKVLLASAAAIVSFTATPVWAQTAADEPADGDIVVTATRGETLLSKTPLAVTAITGDNLRDKGIAGPTGLAESVPNLSIDRTNGLQITIRGVTSTDGTEKGNPSAAFLLDGVYLARPQQADLGFFDVQRVEVLRGPQGTRYGRNTTAGVVNVITNKPELGKMGVGLNVGYGNYSAMNVDGFVNVPMGDSAAFRLSATFDQRDNWISPVAGDTIDTDPFRKNFAARAQVLFNLGENGSVLLRGNYGHLGGTRATGVPTANFYTQSARGTSVLDSRGNAIWNPISNDTDVLLTRNLRSIPHNPAWGGGTDSTNGYDIDDTTWGVDGELNYDFGEVSVTYLGSYREYTAHENSQLDINGLLPANLPGFLVPLMSNFTGDCAQAAELCSYPGFFDGDYQQQSHEVRFAFGGDGPIKLQAGGYYFREHSVIGFWIPDFPQFIIGNNKFYGFPQETTSKTLGAFAEATLKVSDNLRVTAGARYTHDDLFRYGHTVATNNITAPIVLGGSTYANDAQVIGNKVTWRVGFDLDAGRGLFYGSVASGYKQGGFGDGCSTGKTSQVTSRGESCALATQPQAIYYEPETLIAYELGFRGPIMDGLRVDTTVFYYDYKNMQLSSLLNINGAPTQVTTNAGKSSVFGVEFEAIINPTANLQFNFGLNVLDAKYKNFCPGGTGTANPLDPCTAGTPDFAGRTLDRSPHGTAFGTVTWTIPMGDNEVVFSAGSRLIGKYSITQFGASPVQYFTPAHSTSQASLTFNGPDKKWYLQAYVKNIENFIEVRNATADVISPGDPRTFGVRAGIKF